MIPVTRLDCVDSTNRYVRDGLNSGSLTGTGMVIAARQTNGKGRQGRAWASDNALGLWATLYLPGSSTCPFDQVMRLSVAAVESLIALNCPARLKWPNDVLVGRKKISGLLAETTGDHLLIGVGINLNQAPDDFPPDLYGRATSLFIETGCRIEPADFTEALLNRYGQAQDAEALFQRYTGLLGIVDCSMAVDGLPVVVRRVDRSGELVAETVDGQTRTFTSGTLTWQDP